jgi:hypothetical protein
MSIDHLLSNVLLLYVIKACGFVEQKCKTKKNLTYPSKTEGEEDKT